MSGTKPARWRQPSLNVLPLQTVKWIVAIVKESGASDAQSVTDFDQKPHSDNSTIVIHEERR
ncbi:MAG: hypothetical protein ACK58L_06925 [Planctomycetota bacterium]